MNAPDELMTHGESFVPGPAARSLRTWDAHRVVSLVKEFA